jgi:FkbM family methyltransferase
VSKAADVASDTLPRMSTSGSGALHRARRLFYNRGGHYRRAKLFEALGSERYSRPALFGMDARLAEVMPWRDGTFVEAGAHDGFTQSNSYYLERFRGWSGLLIEPIPELHALCERRRPRSRVVHSALVAPERDGAPVEIHFGDLMSTVAAGPSHAAGGLALTGRTAYSVAVPGRTLSPLIDDAGLPRIDLLVLDLEGAELDALAGLDFERHAPRHLLIETLEREQQQPRLEAVLGERYELAEQLSDYDLLYRLRS